MDAVMTADEREVYRLSRMTPGLSQREIAKKLGKNQPWVSRKLMSADAKMAALREVIRATNGDPEALEQVISVADTAPKRPFRRAS